MDAVRGVVRPTRGKCRLTFRRGRPPRGSRSTTTPRSAASPIRSRFARSLAFSSLRPPQRRRQSGARAYRLRIRFLEQHRRFRHQPDFDQFRLGDAPAMAAPSRSGCSIRCLSPGSASCSRPSSASPSASRGCRRTGWWPGPPPAMSRPSAISRCCCNCCSGTTPCSRRCRRMRESLVIPGGIYLNNRGLFLPLPIFKSGFGFVLVAFAVGAIGAVAFYVWARKRQEQTGRQAPVISVALALVIGLPLAGAGACRLPARLRISRRPGASISTAASRSCRNSPRCCSG